jgi:hypothetical protein
MDRPGQAHNFNAFLLQIDCYVAVRLVGSYTYDLSFRCENTKTKTKE